LTTAPATTLDGEASAGRLPVFLFATCLGDVAFPTLADDVRVALAAVDVDPTLPRGATCCGQPAFNAGPADAARRVARTTLRALDPGDAPVVVPSGSCGAMMRLHWPGLFRGTRDEDRARRVAGRVVELTALLAQRRDRLAARSPRWSGQVGWHHTCHMLRELRLAAEPAAVLETVEGLEAVPLAGSERCCGFGGTFSVRYPDLSVAMADSKLDEIEQVGVHTLVSADPGCLMHLGGRLRRRGSQVRALHLASLLREAL
jgi:L-lactate dehydrogenase complex protein LldE